MLAFSLAVDASSGIQWAFRRMDWPQEPLPFGVADDK
jgi:hypothetical protein